MESQLGYTLFGDNSIYTSMPSTDIKPVIDPRVEIAGTRSEPSSFWDKYFGWAGISKEKSEETWNEINKDGPQYGVDLSKQTTKQNDNTFILLAVMGGLMFALIKLKKAGA